MKVLYQKQLELINMELNLLNIGINGASYDQVKDALIDIGVFEKLESISRIFKVRIDLKDYTDAFFSAKNFLIQRNMLDNNPFFNEFDIIPYGLNLDFYVMTDFKYLSFLEPIVFLLAEELSNKLNARCLVAYNKMSTPVALFENGSIIELFEKYSSEFFKNKSWRPHTC